MGKYGIGARVRDPDGDEGVVIDKEKGRREVRYDEDALYDIWWPKGELEATLPKAGDGIRWRAMFDATMLTKGEIYTVVAIDGEGWFKITDDNQLTGDHSWPSSTILDNFDVVAAATADEGGCAKLTLEAGKTYVDRNGKEHGPLEFDRSVISFPYSFDGECWRANGSWWFSGEDNRDLVAEVIAPVVDQSAEQPWEPKVGDRVRYTGDYTRSLIGQVGTVDGKAHRDNVPVTWDHTGLLQGVYLSNIAPAPLTIEAGKFYKTRDGRKVGPIGEHGVPERVNGRVPGEDSDRVWNREGGVNWGAYPADAALDIVAEWVEPAVEPWVPQAGDKVRWTEKFKASMYTKGAVYEIGRVYRGTCYVSDDDNNLDPATSSHSWPSEDLISHFELVSRADVKATTPAIGDKVTLTGTVRAASTDNLTVTFGNDRYHLVPLTALAA